ncbi:MAG: glycosyltransferase family 2 protein [Planctomycetes bacterium]|nr:glycosyltransferase family 2 protein [Planctomycetota bacterium]
MSADSLDVTILVPVFNEEDNVGPLVRSITAVMGRTGRSYEVVIVDDGSQDRTLPRLREAGADAPHLRVVRLRRNFGQTAALAAGFDTARGRLVVTLDGDLQNDPGDIPTILSLLDEGYDLVSGWRRERKEPFFSRRLPSRVANRLLSFLTGVRIHDFGCALKGYRAAFVKALPVYSEMHRYMPALAGSVGARVTEVVVRHHRRRFGVSKYGIGRTIRVLYDLVALRMLTRFSARPLHWFGIGSLPFFLGGLLVLVITFIDHTRGTLVTHSTVVFPTLLILLFYLGFHFLVLGLLSELAVNVLRSSHRYVFQLDDSARRTA